MSPKIKLIQERFVKDPPARQLGAIASDLLRIASAARSMTANPKLLQEVLTELKLYTEWSASAMSIDVQTTLLELQREIRGWNSERLAAASEDVASRASAWSQRILRASGLLG